VVAPLEVPPQPETARAPRASIRIVHLHILREASSARTG